MGDTKDFDGIVGDSPPIRAMTRTILKVAPHDCTVLIRGESGTGKELIARSIQRNSNRSKGPFIPINCGAIPETLMEAHLFGHQKGSFTGASSDKPGIFEAGNGGTIFLDEVGEMPLMMQVKLLRALQEKEIVRVGGTKPIKTDVRLIAATNRDLAAMLKSGQFRSDLYYRIAALEIQVPALRYRREDIPSLAQHFVEKISGQTGFGQPIRIDRSALDALARHHWPGNVRELENVISRLIILTQDSIISAADVENAIHSKQEQPESTDQTADEGTQSRLVLPSSICEVSAHETIGAYLRRAKLAVLQTAMDQFPNRQAAAERLGLAEDTVRKQLRYLRKPRQQSRIT